jgi:hypothetical protein
MVEAMQSVAAERGLERLIAPVRPILKHQYPLTPMERYLRWKHPGGEPFDPWVRVHTRLGGRVLNICPRSMRIQGRVADWESWTGMRFPESGSYVVPGALAPVEFDVEADVGLYLEPNIWMCHALRAT